MDQCELLKTSKIQNNRTQEFISHHFKYYLASIFNTHTTGGQGMFFNISKKHFFLKRWNFARERVNNICIEQISLTFSKRTETWNVPFSFASNYVLCDTYLHSLSMSGVGKVRPAGQSRPAKTFGLARSVAFLTLARCSSCKNCKFLFLFFEKYGSKDRTNF